MSMVRFMVTNPMPLQRTSRVVGKPQKDLPIRPPNASPAIGHRPCTMRVARRHPSCPVDPHGDPCTLFVYSHGLERCGNISLTGGRPIPPGVALPNPAPTLARRVGIELRSGRAKAYNPKGAAPYPVYTCLASTDALWRSCGPIRLHGSGRFASRPERGPAPPRSGKIGADPGSGAPTFVGRPSTQHRPVPRAGSTPPLHRTRIASPSSDRGRPWRL